MFRSSEWTRSPRLLILFFLTCSLNQNLLVYSQVLTATVPSYAPVTAQCPSDNQILRSAGSAALKNQTLCQAEEDFRRGRKAVLSSLWADFFTNGPGKAAGYRFAQNQQDWPVLGIAHSGGGERAALYGAGVYHALDSRTSASPIRGVYQLATYVTGLSGGSWFVASIAANNYPIAPQLVDGWQLEKDLVLPGGINIIRSGQFFDALKDTVELKKDAGFNATLTDIWGRAIGYHFLPGTTSENFYQNSPATAHGAGLLFSSLRNTESARQFQNALPIIVSDHKPVNESGLNQSSLPTEGTTLIPLSAPVYEISPFEFGSFDPRLSTFIKTEFLGTSLDSGKPFINSEVKESLNPGPNQRCVRGFDQISFIMGSSATLFNAATGVPNKYTGAFKTLYSKLTNKSLDQPFTARYPNPFKGLKSIREYDRAHSDELLIVDGGENGENIPLDPLLVPARGVDVIVAADASADSGSRDPNGSGWPDGASMINSFVRVHQVLPKGSANFPDVPLDPKVWEENRYSSRPTFFGCNAISKQGNGGYPLIIYLPNTPSSQVGYFTNTSTFDLRYSKKEADLFLEAVMNSTTKPMIGSNRVDSEWPTCLSCALIDRSRNRNDIARSTPCTQCFERYCYQNRTTENPPKRSRPSIDIVGSIGLF